MKFANLLKYVCNEFEELLRQRPYRDPLMLQEVLEYLPDYADRHRPSVIFYHQAHALFLFLRLPRYRYYKDVR